MNESYQKKEQLHFCSLFQLTAITIIIQDYWANLNLTGHKLFADNCLKFVCFPGVLLGSLLL